MIELRTLDGEIIELQSSEITIELNNSLFNDGVNFKGSLSYPINIAGSPKNRRLLGFADQLEVSLKSANIPVQVRLSSKTFKQCLLKIGVSENGFVGSLKLDIGSINDHIRELKFTDVPFKSIQLGNGITGIKNQMYKAAENTNWRVIPYTFFPVQNVDFFKDKKKDEQPPLINAFKEEFVVSSPQDTTPVVPYFYLSYVLQELATWLGLTLKGDFAFNPLVGQIVVYNVSGIGSVADVKINAAQHLPSMRIADFFKALNSFFCVRIKVDDSRKELDISWKKSTFEKPKYRDWREKLITVIDQQFQDFDGYTISGQVDNSDSEKETIKKKDEVVFGPGKTKIEAKAGTLEFIPLPIDRYSTPTDKREGIVIQPNDTRIDTSTSSSIPLRLLFTTGCVDPKNAAAPKYPRGSYVGESFDLKISGEKGLFNYAHQPWMNRIYASKIIKAKFLLDINDLNNLNDEDIIRIKSTNAVSVECLVKKLTFTTARHQNKILAEAELVILDTARLNMKGSNYPCLR